MDSTNLTLNFIHTLVELVGFGVLIWKGSAFIATMASHVKQQKENQQELKDSLDLHTATDAASFKEISTTLTNLRISVASHGTGSKENL